MLLLKSRCTFGGAVGNSDRMPLTFEDVANDRAYDVIVINN
jgi:hypothetical protein